MLNSRIYFFFPALSICFKLILTNQNNNLINLINSRFSESKHKNEELMYKPEEFLISKHGNIIYTEVLTHTSDESSRFV